MRLFACGGERDAGKEDAPPRDWVGFDGPVELVSWSCHGRWLAASGGTMLLVDASLHRAGLRFPELPYRELIETEGFAALARDVGIIPIGLPKVEVLHVPW